MKKILSGNYYKVFLIRIIFVFLLFSLTRLLFFIFNQSHFSEVHTGEFLLIMFHGLIFDLSAITACYFFFILASILPLHFKHKNYYQNILLVLFTFSTAIAMVANLADCAYFAFTLSRTTADIFNVFGLGSDFSTLLPSYLLDFWYFLFIWFVLVFLTVWFFKKTKVNPPERKSLVIFYLKETFLFIIISALGIIGFRGGLQLRPISIITVGEYTSSANVALVLNTPFSIIKTIGKSGVKNIEYYDEQKLNSIFSPVHNYHKKDKAFKPHNVIVIILESFSKEYSGEMNKELEGGTYKGYTPFLDSLMRQGLYFTNAYANGKRSIEAIPTILAGIPSLMNDAYITSKYAGNNINSLANLLKTKSYSSAFFHGGTNGTMGFTNFANMASFDKYFGRTEYNKEKDYDGKWGIYDEPFLKYTAATLDAFPKPFIVGIFTLSSHHPYHIPEKYAKRFPKGKLDIHQSIAYSDFALQQFFKELAKKPWFDSTLFVLTADHTSESFYPQYQTRVGMYEVPLIFYCHNSKLKGKNENIAQQADIMPSVLDYLNYDKAFVSIGSSVFDTLSNHFAISYVNETYQLIYKDYALVFDGENDLSLYHFANDPLLKNNLLRVNVALKNELERLVKAIIQSYNHRLIKNEMVVKAG